MAAVLTHNQNYDSFC